MAAGVFVLGIGLGIFFSSSVTLNSGNVVSREAIDRSVPNAEFCAQYGASAVVSDVRVFMSFNPFSVYVTQPVMQPGCVVRRSNWSVLEKQGLISSSDSRDCRNRMNTFGFTGRLEDSPDVKCLYQNDSAGNLFPSNNAVGDARPENDNF